MNYGELQTEVLGHQLNDTKYRPSVKRWLNEAQEDIARRISLRTQFESLTTTTDSHFFALPADYLRLIEVSLATDPNDWQRLGPIELRDFDEAPVSYGTPTGYVIAGQKIYLYPYPEDDVSIAINYYRLPAEMVEDSDEPEIPATYHYLLARYALIRAFQRENDYEAAQYWRNEYETDLSRAAGEAHHDAYEGPLQVPGGWDEASPGYWTTWR